VTADDSRAGLIEQAASQPEKVQQLACIAACERAYPLVNRLGRYKSRLVTRYAIEELWDHVLFESCESNFLSMLDWLPEVSAWDTNDPAYYAMSGISVVAHTRKFLESSEQENLAYAVGTLFDLATEYDITLGSVASSKTEIRDMEIACQRKIYTLVSARSVKKESLRAALTYEEPINLFCSLRGWFEPPGH